MTNCDTGIPEGSLLSSPCILGASARCIREHSLLLLPESS